jgi:hypothetical protein
MLKGKDKNMNDIRVEKRLFCAWNEEKEIKWLKNMAKQGWELDHAGFCEYQFKKTEKQDLNFSFDYRVLKKDEFDEYIRHFESCGWEYISSVASWHYFKSKVSETVYPDIYSENTSKIEKYKRLLVTLCLAIFPSIWAIVFNLTLLDEEFSLFTLIIVLLIVFMNTIIIYGIYRICRIIQQLRRNL